MNTKTCPECNEGVPIPEDVMTSELITCPTCGSELLYNGKGLEPANIVGEDFGE